jgi:uncharacterized protein (TIGR02246 family)
MADNTIVPESPEALMRTFAARLNSRDLDGLVALYEPGAVFEPAPGTVVRGHGEIRAALNRFLELEPTMSSEVVQVLESGGIALVVNEWSMSGTAPDGTPVHQSGRSSDVVRRQPEGGWLVMVDKP